VSVADVLIGAYRGRRVLVTGDSGFKGSWLALWLTELGAEVTGLSLPAERANDHFSLLKLERNIRHVDCDIRDHDAVNRVFEAARPEIVFHLAAQALVRRSYADPRRTFATNVSGSVNILEAVRATPTVQSLVYVTSDKCYRNREWVWGYRENDELGGRDPYSASKAAAELVFSCYCDTFFYERPKFGAASTRAGNVIGGGDWSEDRLVPDCIRSLKAGEPIRLRNPGSTRPWQHVLDPLYGYLMLGLRLIEDPKKFSGSWNFGPDAFGAKPVSALASRIVELWGSGRVEIVERDAALYEAGLLHLNVDKAKHAMGWVQRWAFDRAVAETVSWYAALHGGADAATVSRRQIAGYMSSD
jgi:CDP-glucose 4,6-dehydratase